MSENIQSISNGTFTIGSTSATNFVAGPGITITEPSAGTVRIGNDETVLWSGDSVTGTLNESIANFERLKIYARQKDGTNRSCYNETLVVNGYCEPSFVHMFHNNTNIYTTYASYSFTGNSFSLLNAGYTRSPFNGGSTATQLFTFSGNESIKINKVIGINRIGGNE